MSLTISEADESVKLAKDSKNITREPNRDSPPLYVSKTDDEGNTEAGEKTLSINRSA